MSRDTLGAVSGRPPTLPDEERIVAQARGGDRRAFEQIYRAYARTLYGYVLIPMLGDADDAEDCLREAIAWQVNAAKYVATNNAIRVTDLALRVVGSAGLARGLPLERFFRDVRAGLGNPPMDDIALTLIGRAALGI